MSQFAPGQRVYQSNFPMRNRLMAALTNATVIVEAGETSGTLHKVGECVRSSDGCSYGPRKHARFQHPHHRDPRGAATAGPRPSRPPNYDVTVPGTTARARAIAGWLRPASYLT